MKEWDMRKKWLTKRAIWRLMLLSAAILVIAAIFEFAQQVVTSNFSPIEKIGYILFMWLVLAGSLLSFAMISPDLMDTISKMLGFGDEEEEKDENKT
jgi:TRAP-type C4-dicarboxylate transport system permease small subunit